MARKNRVAKKEVSWDMIANKVKDYNNQYTSSLKMSNEVKENRISSLLMQKELIEVENSNDLEKVSNLKVKLAAIEEEHILLEERYTDILNELKVFEVEIKVLLEGLKGRIVRLMARRDVDALKWIKEYVDPEEEIFFTLGKSTKISEADYMRKEAAEISLDDLNSTVLHVLHQGKFRKLSKSEAEVVGFKTAKYNVNGMAVEAVEAVLFEQIGGSMDEFASLEVIESIKSLAKDSNLPPSTFMSLVWKGLVDNTPKNLYRVLGQIKRWKDLLKGLCPSKEDQLLIIYALQDWCHEDHQSVTHHWSPTHSVYHFWSRIMETLYKNDVLSAAGIFHWAEKGTNPNSRKDFLKGIEFLLKSLKGE